MCLPKCFQKVAAAMSRRRLLAGTGAAAATGLAFATPAASPPPASRFRTVFDLTHPLGPDFPTFSGKPQLSLQAIGTLKELGWNMNQWTLDEHTGTHLDAPFHKSSGPTADRIPAADLVGPLAVIDIRQKAEADADAELTLDDVKAWESQHGPLPEGCIVAMCSGWDTHVRSDRFRNADAKGVLHFPGFHREAADFLIHQRQIKGMVVDTLSLDHGASTEFPVHVNWLGSGRWGLECAANLAQLPAIGATVVVGGPRIIGASGGPSRVFALL